MQISQSAIFRLCCASFLTGLLLALFYDLLYMTRLWLLPPDNRYTIPSIQKRYFSRIQKKKSHKKRIRFHISRFFGDIFFCIVSALAIILLLYWLNNGAFRAAAPLVMALGFFLWRVSISKGIRFAFQWLAFITETVIYTLLLPLKRVVALIVTTYQKNALKRRHKRLAKQRQNYTKQQIQNVAKAAEKLLPIDIKTIIPKGDGRAKQRKKAV